MSEQNPVFPQPVAEGEDGWDLQQRDVQERIEAALVRPELGDGATLVGTFQDDADIAAHMLPPEHGYYGLDTHTYRFSVAAQRQFWDWHFRNEERIRQERLAEHERKTAEFNRKINERRAAIEAAKPAIELAGQPTMRRHDFGVVVRATVGAGPGPLDYYYFAYRPVEMRGQPDHTWTKWRVDFLAHNMPKEEVIYTLDPNREYDIAVYGGSRHGGVYSDPVTVSMQGGVGTAPEAPAAPESAPQQQAAEEAPPKPPEAPEIRGHRMGGVWGNAWDRFPGIAPGRHYGTIQDDAFRLPNGQMAVVTALFLTDSRTLRVTLTPGTPADQFPPRIQVETGGHVNVFDLPGPAQTFGLGEARDYTLAFGSPGHIRVGVRSEFVLEG